MELINLQFVYDEMEDRLLMRVAVAEDRSEQELRAWLTRRFIASFWLALQRGLSVQMTLIHPGAAHASAELVDMAHRSAIDELTADGAFANRFRSDLPAHSELNTPFLVTEAKFHIVANEPMRINFLPVDGAGFEITFDDTELHGFCTLLLESVRAAQWDIPVQFESAWDEMVDQNEQADAEFDAAPEVTPRRLN